jgi:TatA/E family protein of Tat protein translocase
MAATSPLTWIIIFGIALIFFGPKQLPKIAKSVGETLKSLRDSTSGIEEEVKKSLEDPSPTSSETSEKS